MIRLYGVDKGNTSWPRVTHGIRQALRVLAHFSGFYDVQSIDSSYDDDAVQPGYDAPVGLCIGPPLAASVMIRGTHRERLLMIATNSSWLPETLMEKAQQHVTGFIGTSTWATSVIEKYAGDVPVYTWLHGIESGFRRSGPPATTHFRVLHLASTHMQRKGTAELIQGWAIAKREHGLPPGATLRLVVDGPRGYFLQEIGRACEGDIKLADSYELLAPRNLSVDAMRDFYSEHHVVCQPSRGEGFGLVPLEARACGIPVIATACTGHADHIKPDTAIRDGVVVIPHGSDALIDDGPGAMAPAVNPEHIAEGLGRAYHDLAQLRAASLDACEGLRRKWSWASTTANFLSAHGAQLGLT